MSFPSEIEQQVHALREYVNEPNLKARLRELQSTWLMLCSALDLLGDTELALHAFRTYSPESEVAECDGDRYLAVYGVLQAMFLQQDAVAGIHRALAVPLSPNPTLTAIRELRNDSIGHPSNRGNGKSFHFLTRRVLSRDGFELVSFASDGSPPVTRSVTLWRLIADQQSAVAEILGGLIQYLHAIPKQGDA